jgi:hypothetical protein
LLTPRNTPKLKPKLDAGKDNITRLVNIPQG